MTMPADRPSPAMGLRECDLEALRAARESRKLYEDGKCIAYVETTDVELHREAHQLFEFSVERWAGTKTWKRLTGWERECWYRTADVARYMHRRAASEEASSLRSALADLLDLYECSEITNSGDVPQHEYDVIRDGAMERARGAVRGEGTT